MRPLSRTAPFALAVALAALSPAAARACSCSGIPEFAEAYAGSVAVFAGTPIAVRPAPEAFQSVWVKFAVEDAWKGVTTTTFEVLTADNEGICGVAFLPATRYLVYAVGGTPGPWTHLCWRTHPWYADDPDLVALGPPPSVPAASRTWGSLKSAYHR